MLLISSISGQEVQEQSRQASKAMAEGRYREAAVIYEKLVALVPGNAGLQFNLGLALFSAGEYLRAEAALNKVARQQPGMQPAWLLLGLTYQKRNLPLQAIDPLRTALRLKPADGAARFELADAYLNTGHLALASREFQTLADREPANAKAWQGLGVSYLEMAVLASKRLDRAAPDSGFRYALLAESRARQKRWPEAFWLYRRALALGPPIANVHRAVARVYEETGHADWAATEAALEAPEAPADWPEALKRFEGQATPEALYWTSRACTALFGQALGKLQDLPESGALQELRAESDELQGRRAEAVAEWRAALRFSPGEARLEGSLARALWRNREYDEAQPLLARMASRQPAVAEWRYLLGDLYYRQQQAAKAAPHLEAALQREPDQVAAHAILGRVYMQLGQPAKAIAHLQAALATDEDGSLHYQLGLAYRRTGQEQLAQTMFALQRDMQGRSAAVLETPITPPDAGMKQGPTFERQ